MENEEIDGAIERIRNISPERPEKTVKPNLPLNQGKTEKARNFLFI